MQSISLTIPMDANALTRASDMLHGLALDLSKADRTLLSDEVEVEEETPAAEVFGAETTAKDTPAPPPPGVELDKAGLPWDARIHAASKKKLAKTETWKLKRGVEQTLVDQVEAELRAAMAASPTNPIEPAPPPPAEDPAAAQTNGEATTITTFPQLMTAITANDITPETVQAAVNKQGLASTALLAARPDLIPAVAAELFGAV